MENFLDSLWSPSIRPLWASCILVFHISMDPKVTFSFTNQNVLILSKIFSHFENKSFQQLFRYWTKDERAILIMGMSISGIFYECLRPFFSSYWFFSTICSTMKIPFILPQARTSRWFYNKYVMSNNIGLLPSQNCWGREKDLKNLIFNLSHLRPI